MNRLMLMAALLAGLPTPSGAQSIPDGVYSSAEGPSEMCGLVGANASDLLTAAHRSAELRPMPIASDRFIMFSGGSSIMYQLVATLPSEAAYPAVTCREVYEEDGAVRMRRSMRCDAERADCDALFLEFHTLDQEIIRQLQDAGR
jgi:hypothetical protein